MEGVFFNVPFDKQGEIYSLSKASVSAEVLAKSFKTTPRIIESIVAHQKRLEMRFKYDVDKEPA